MLVFVGKARDWGGNESKTQQKGKNAKTQGSVGGSYVQRQTLKGTLRGLLLVLMIGKPTQTRFLASFQDPFLPYFGYNFERL